MQSSREANLKAIVEYECPTEEVGDGNPRKNRGRGPEYM